MHKHPSIDNSSSREIFCEDKWNKKTFIKIVTGDYATTFFTADTRLPILGIGQRHDIFRAY